MAVSHPLKHYWQRAAAYLRRARATRRAAVAPRGGTVNYELAGYQRHAAEYWRRALAIRDPVLQGALSALAGRFQEMASRRENRLARRGTANEPAGSACERRLRSLLMRTLFLRQRRRRAGG